jgi:hypothetical protein
MLCLRYKNSIPFLFRPHFVLFSHKSYHLSIGRAATNPIVSSRIAVIRHRDANFTTSYIPPPVGKLLERLGFPLSDGL